MASGTNNTDRFVAGSDIPRPRFSRFYAKISEALADEGLAELRADLLGGLTGRVVEIGAGNGVNFRHYPATVTDVVAIEPEPRLRALAEQAAAAAPVTITVKPGTAGQLPHPDASVDGGVLCLVLCSVKDRPAALAEIRRVLRLHRCPQPAAPLPGAPGHAALDSACPRRCAHGMITECPSVIMDGSVGDYVTG